MGLIKNGVQTQIVAAVIASLGIMAIGTVIGRWGMPDIIMTFDYSKDDKDIAMIVLCFSAIVSALLSGVLTNLYGYKWTIIISELFIFFGWMLVTEFLKKHYALLAGCVLQGLGVGAISATIPTYVGEISQSNIRGALGVFFHAFLTIGVLFTYALAVFIKDIIVMDVMCAVLAMVHAIGMFFIPESPYFFLRKGQMDKANLSMSKLRDDDTVNQELSVIQSDIDQQKYQQDTFRKVLTNRANIKALMINFGVLVICPSLYNKFIMSDILKICKHCDHQKTLIFVLFAIQVILTFVTMKIIDKLGRKVLLVLSAVLMGLCSITFYGYFKFIHDSNTSSWILLTPIIIYISAFSLGYGPVKWVLIGEIFPTSVKILGPGVITALYWFVFLTQYAAEEETLKLEYYFILSCVLWFLGAVFVWFYVPETKNKSLIQIKDLLTKSDSSSSAQSA